MQALRSSMKMPCSCISLYCSVDFYLLALMGKLANILGGRVARNVYFWLLLLSTRLDFDNNATTIAITGLLFLLLAILFYVNNLLLIPRLLQRKKYGEYIAGYGALTLLISFLYTCVLKAMLVAHPDWHVGRVSAIVAGDEVPSFAIDAFLVDWGWYFVFLSVASAVFAMSWYVTDYQRQQKIIEETKKEHLEMQLRFLKSQVNPHFLFNSLNNLYTLTLQKSDTAPEVVAGLSDILRYLLYESDTRLVSFDREKEIIEAYIKLELLRLQNTGGLHFSITADGHYQVPPLLWLPLLENVFKHGTRFISAEHAVHFSFTVTGNVMWIHSRNTFKATQASAGAQGMGLKNLEQRLQLIFGDKYELVRTIDGDQYIAAITADLACIKTY